MQKGALAWSERDKENPVSDPTPPQQPAEPASTTPSSPAVPLTPPYASGYAWPAYPPTYGAPQAPAAGHPMPPRYPQQPGTVYPPAGYAPPYGYAGYPAVPRTNSLAITSMVSSLVGVVFSWTWILGLGVIVGVITGHIALGQIRRTGESGRGMALAGVIIGWVSIAAGALIVILLLALWATAASGGFSTSGA